MRPCQVRMIINTVSITAMVTPLPVKPASQALSACTVGEAVSKTARISSSYQMRTTLDFLPVPAEFTVYLGREGIQDSSFWILQPVAWLIACRERGSGGTFIQLDDHRNSTPFCSTLVYILLIKHGV